MITAPDATRRFSNRVADYIKYRPRYPADLIPLLAREIGLEKAWRIADIGSGTGISSEPFLRHGNTVIAVEPNAEMRQAAESLLKSYSGFVSIAGTAEATTLDNGFANMIVAGQAFHWFDRAGCRLEFARILMPPGWVALIWNRRSTDATPILRDYERLLNTHGVDYAKVRHDNIATEALSAFYGGPFEYRVLPKEQVFDFEGLRGRLLSSSYVPAEGQAGFEPMIEDLARLFQEHEQAKRVRFEYETDIYFGRLS